MKSLRHFVLPALALLALSACQQESPAASTSSPTPLAAATATPTDADLIAQGVINAEKVAWLADHVRRGRSVVVAALRSGTGKSTLAHALIAEVDPERSRVYVRGSYEPFDWLASSDPNRTTILVNEISDHLPVYCWGVCAN